MRANHEVNDLQNINLNTGFMLGDWWVEPLAGCFKRGGNSVHVEPRVMDVLLCLVRARGEIVSRDQMLEVVWAGVVVSEEVLTRAISELRTLLGDTHRERRYVRTVPKRGYALIAAVTPARAGAGRPGETLPESDFQVIPGAIHSSSAGSPAAEDIQSIQSVSSVTSGESARIPGKTENKPHLPWFVHLVRDFFSLLKAIVHTFGRVTLMLLGIVVIVLVYALVDDGANITIDDEGEHIIKSSNAAIESKGHENKVGKHSVPTLAVLPFIDFSGNEEWRYFSDGLSEDIRNALISVPGIKVVARTSSQVFENKALDIRDIGKRLGVEALVEGTVRIQANAARITVQLTDAKSGFPKWSRGYDRTLEDVFSVQKEIAEDVVRQIAPQLSASLPVEPVINQKAHYHYLLGRHFWHQRTSETTFKAINHFEKAIEEDDQYALAYSGLADAHLFSHLYAGVEEVEALKQAQTYASKALMLAPELAEAHASQGLIYQAHRQYQQARISFERAVSIKPSYTMAKMWYGTTLLALDEVDLAYREYREALEIDPLHPVIQQNYLQVLTVMGRYNEAIKLAEEMYLVSGEERLLKASLHALLQAGRYDELLQFAVRYNFSRHYEYHASLAVAEALIKLQRFQEAEDLLARLPPSEEKMDWGEYEQKASLALGKRDSEEMRRVVASISDTYNDEPFLARCANARKTYWLGIADYMEGKMVRAVGNFSAARDAGFLSCEFDEDLRISLLIYLGDSLNLTGKSEESARILVSAQERFERATRQGWGHTSLRGSEIALHLLNNNIKGLKKLIESLLAEGVQPWANLVAHPIFDQYLRHENIQELFKPFKNAYEARRLASADMQLAKFGL